MRREQRDAPETRRAEPLSPRREEKHQSESDSRRHEERRPQSSDSRRESPRRVARKSEVPRTKSDVHFATTAILHNMGPHRRLQCAKTVWMEPCHVFRHQEPKTKKDESNLQNDIAHRHNEKEHINHLCMRVAGHEEWRTCVRVRSGFLVSCGGFGPSTAFPS